MPDDIHRSLWLKVIEIFEAGQVAVTTEIYGEMFQSIGGEIGKCIDAHKASMVLEIGDPTWNYQLYVQNVAAMQLRHHEVIAEYTNSKRTVGLNDISVIALAKTLGLPLVSMEKPVSVGARQKRKIPDVCLIEMVRHLNFSEFLREAGISL